MFGFSKKKSPAEQGKKIAEKLKINEEKLWKEFKGKGNSDEILFDKAKAASPVVIALAIENTKSLFQDLEDKEWKVDSDKFSEVLFEIVLFYLHFIDTQAYQYLEDKQRESFMFALLTQVRELIPSIQGIDGTRFYSTFESAFNKRTMEYGKYKYLWHPEGLKKVKDTLYWKLGEKITEILDLKMNTLFHLILTMNVFPNLVLQLPELFED